MLEWLQLNAAWIALPLAVVLSVIGWFVGVRPAIRRHGGLQQRQKGGRGSVNVQVGSVTTDSSNETGTGAE